MKGKTKTIKINHRNYGTVSVKIDAEDADLFETHSVYITECGSSNGPMIRFDSDSSVRNNYRPYAARIILEKHGMLNSSKNVFYKHGDHFDLRKSQLFQI